MKAFLLAAGIGSRLRPITFSTPKCLVPIGDTTLIDIWYNKLESMKVTEVLVNTHHLNKKIEDHISKLNTSIKTTIIHEKKLLGSAGTILANKNFIDNDPFWIIYSDNLTTANLGAILSMHEAYNPMISMGLFRSKKPELCGVVNIDGFGKVVDFQEKPKNPKGNLVNAGIMVVSPKIINHIPNAYPCDLSFHIIPNLIGDVYGKMLDGFFMDIGTLESYDKVQKEWALIKNNFTN